MLKEIRGSVAGWAVKILMGVLIASFMMWGVTDFLRVAPDSAVAEVGDREISVRDFQLAFQRQVQNLQQRFGPTFTSEQARQFGLDTQTLQQMVGQALFDNVVDDLELTASDDQVAEAIRTNPSFQGEVGGFDRFRYDEVLRSNGYTEATYVEVMRRQMSRQQLLDSLIGGLVAPKSLVNAYYTFQSEKRKIETLTIPYADMTDIADPTDGDISEYHSAHNDEFMAPEYRRISFVTVKPEDLLAEIPVSEEDLQTDYDRRRSEFSQEETRAVEQLLLADKTAADDVAELLKTGADFYQVAQKKANFTAEDVKLGTVKKSGLPEAVRDLVFSLPLNKAGDPVEGPFGWVVYRVTKITPASEQTFADVRDQIERELKLQNASEAIYDLSTRLDDSLAGGATLEETANVANLIVTTIAMVDAQGRDQAGNPAKDLPEISSFLQTAFQTETNVEPALYETDEGGYYFLRVDNIVEPALRPVSDVRDAIFETLQENRRIAAAKKIAAELAGKASAGVTFAGLIGNKGWEVKTSELETRTSMMQKAVVGTKLMQDLFSAGQSQILFGDDNLGDGQVIARVVDIQQGDLSGAEADLNQISSGIIGSLSNDLLNQYRIALEAEYGVNVDEAAINATFAPSHYN
jgi:peptidyl-prolyl cis-trans isomerase D